MPRRAAAYTAWVFQLPAAMSSNRAASPVSTGARFMPPDDSGAGWGQHGGELSWWMKEERR